VAFKENLDCEGHRVFIRSNREKAKSKEKLAEEVAAGVDHVDVSNDIVEISETD
jgi:hypothetical protein